MSTRDTIAAAKPHGATRSPFLVATIAIIVALAGVAVLAAVL